MFCQRQRGRAQALPVVLNPQYQGPRALFQADGDEAGLGMAGDILQSLLRNAIRALLDNGCQVAFDLCGEVQFQQSPAAFRRRLGQFPQGQDKPQILERRGPQGLQGPARFGEPGARSFIGLVEYASSSFWIDLPQRPDRLQLDGHSAERMGQGIVEFARQAVALAADGQLLDGSGVLLQPLVGGGLLLVGLGQCGALIPLHGDERDDHIADEQHHGRLQYEPTHVYGPG